MYIGRDGTGRYRYLCSTSREAEGNGFHHDSVYLGVAVDEANLIFQNRKDGIFQLDLDTGEKKPLPNGYVAPKITDHRKKIRLSAIDFGDVFFVDQFIRGNHFDEVIKALGYGNYESLISVIIFYVVSYLPNVWADQWYEGSIIKLLYPNACMNSQRISDLLESVGKPDNVRAFHEKYIRYIYTHYSDDPGILIDSTGLPNAIRIALSQVNNHNGVIEREARFIMVGQITTGLPIYARCVPGNIVDKMTLATTMAIFRELGGKVNLVLADCGYMSAPNLDLFYNQETGELITDYVIRASNSDKRLKEAIQQYRETIGDDQNMFLYRDRVLYGIRTPCKVGESKGKDAYLYLFLDEQRRRDESDRLRHKLVSQEISQEEYLKQKKNVGFFALISGTMRNPEQVVPQYYLREDVEQIFDFSKGYAKLLPIGCRKTETFQGHLMISFIATAIIKMMQLQLKTTDNCLAGKLEALRVTKAEVFSSKIVLTEVNAEGNKILKAFGVSFPKEIPVNHGTLILKDSYLEEFITYKRMMEDEQAAEDRQRAKEEKAAEKKRKAEERAAKKKEKEEKQRQKEFDAAVNDEVKRRMSDEKIKAMYKKQSDK